MTTAYAVVSGIENGGVLSVRDGGHIHHQFSFQLTRLNRQTGKWEAPRNWGGGVMADRIADFDADLAILGYRRVGEWVYDPTNRWATGYETTVEAL